MQACPRSKITCGVGAIAYDHVVILGPHEVAEFSGGAKYLFPGISGPAMINATHSLASVVEDQGLSGLFVGDYLSAWSDALDLSAEHHIRSLNAPFQRVLSCAPPLYDQLRTGSKDMYKLEPAVAVGGEIAISRLGIRFLNRSADPTASVQPMPEQNIYLRLPRGLERVKLLTGVHEILWCTAFKSDTEKSCLIQTISNISAPMK